MLFRNFHIFLVLILSVCLQAAAWECPEGTVNKYEKFSSLKEGDVVTNQLELFTVNAVGGSGKAMIFDSNCSGSNCSGQDPDLGVNLGNILIVSEDGNSSDPDDSSSASKLILNLRKDIIPRSLYLVDVEEGASVKLYKDSSLVLEKSVVTQNGYKKAVDLGKSLADKIIIDFNGSGATGKLEFCVKPYEHKDYCAVEYEVNQHAVWLGGYKFVTFKNQPLNLVDTKDGKAKLTGLLHLDGKTSSTIELNVNLEDGNNYPDQSPKNPFNADTDRWYFFLKISGVMYGRGDLEGLEILIERVGPPFQIGIGANDKDYNDFGASSWFNWVVTKNLNNVTLPFKNSGKGDFNLDLFHCEKDCLGLLGGSAVIDECGVCNGNGPGECGCDLNLIKDDCGVCGGTNQDKGCDGVCFSDVRVDSCGVCGGSGPGECGCNTSINRDDCGVCGGNNNDKGCDGVCFSNVKVDSCGMCGGNGPGECGCDLSIKKDKCGFCGGDGKSCEEIKVCRELQPGVKAEIVTIKRSEYNQFTDSENLSDCELVDICFHGEDLSVQRTFLTDYTGYSLGKCVNACPDEVKCGEICSLDIYPNDPSWFNHCVQSCVENCGLFCKPEESDCIYEPLQKTACASANSFLGQINIASVINFESSDITVTVNYIDLYGKEKGLIKAGVAGNSKRDFLINEYLVGDSDLGLGLKKDTYGTVCVTVDPLTDYIPKWSGGVTLYKSDTSNGENGWGNSYDFSLRYPFVNPTKGIQNLSLNTYKLGSSKVANWIRITDAVRDNNPLIGMLMVFNSEGVMVKEVHVHIPDGGRFDYSGHDLLESFGVEEMVGLAVFVPEKGSNNEIQSFYFSGARYYYNCHEAVNPFACNNFLSAFIIPNRPAITNKVFNTASTVEGLISVVEVTNVTNVKDALALVTYYAEGGSELSSFTIKVPAFGSRHLIVNEVADNQVTQVEVNSGGVYMSSLSLFYKLENNVLQYGFSTPFTEAPGNKQMSEFNSFISQENTVEVTNVTLENKTAIIEVLDYLGNLLTVVEYSLTPKTTRRFTLPVVENIYGTMVISGEGILVRNFVKKGNQYVIPFFGNRVN